MHAIPDYYLAQFPSSDQAEATAKAIADGCLALGLEYEEDHSLRAVIWADAASASLYLSVGALQLAQEIGLPIVPTRRLLTTELPADRVLLLGTVQDRA
jgi:hypothetical protein